MRIEAVDDVLGEAVVDETHTFGVVAVRSEEVPGERRVGERSPAPRGAVAGHDSNARDSSGVEAERRERGPVSVDRPPLASLDAAAPVVEPQVDPLGRIEP